MKLIKAALWGLGTGLGIYFVTRRSSAITAPPGPSVEPEPIPPSPGDMRVNSIVDKALSEYERWDGRLETDPSMRPVLDEYWRSAGTGPQDPSVPWSAAFVTYVVQNTIPEALLPTGAHINYTRQAYQDRGQSGKYGAYDPYDLPVRSGDIIVTSRGDQRTTWHDIENGIGDFRKTHGDIVTNIVDRGLPGLAAIGIGGNVANSVSRNVYPLDSQGRLVPDKPYIALLRFQP